MINRTRLLIIISSLILSFTTQAKGLETMPLTKVLITEKLAGNTIKGSGWVMLVTKDGKLIGEEGGYGDRGRWNATSDGLFCRTWNSWGKGQESCFQVFVAKEVQLKFKNVSGPTATFAGKLLSGNPNDL